MPRHFHRRMNALFAKLMEYSVPLRSVYTDRFGWEASTFQTPSARRKLEDRRDQGKSSNNETAPIFEEHFLQSRQDVKIGMTTVTEKQPLTSRWSPYCCPHPPSPPFLYLHPLSLLSIF